MVRYLNPADYNPSRIKKVDKLYGDKLDFVKGRGVNKIERKNPLTLVFLILNIKKNILYVSKKICENKHIDLLFIDEREKSTMLYSEILTYDKYDSA